MNISHSGEFAALLTACLWATGITLFEQVTRRIGTVITNFVKVVVAFLFLSVFIWIMRSTPLPVNVPADAWLWLSLSALFGFIIGDLLLFQALKLAGARVTMLVYSFSPVMTAIGGFFFLEETLRPIAIAGIALTLGGILLVVLRRSSIHSNAEHIQKLIGAALAAIAAVCQAGGYLFSKQGMHFCDSVTATHIRFIVAVAGFGIIVVLSGSVSNILPVLRNRYALPRLVFAAVISTFIGVTLSMFALANANAGVASTILATVPILLLIPSVFIFKERLSVYDISGTIAAVFGVAMFFI